MILPWPGDTGGEGMSLLQLHHQFKDGTTEMCAQREVDTNAEIKKFIEDTKVSHPLPEGAMWLAVPEDSPQFWGVPV